MANEFKVTRYGFTYFRDGKRFTSAPLYATLQEAREAARADNKRVDRTGTANVSKAVEIDLTNEVVLRAEAIAIDAQNGEDYNVTAKAIIALIQFTQRGY